MDLTYDDIDQLPAGRELDSYVAQYVYGHHIVQLEEPYGKYTYQVLDKNGARIKFLRAKDLKDYPSIGYTCPVYSVSDYHTLDILRQLRLCLEPQSYVPEDEWACYDPVLTDSDHFGNPTLATAGTIQHVICLAALKTVLAREEEGV